MAIRAELYCYFCGHGLGDVLVPTRRRPTVEQLRAAYLAMALEEQPEWDSTGQPICPRCHGQLFLEKHEHEVVRPAEARHLKKAS